MSPPGCIAANPSQAAVQVYILQVDRYPVDLLIFPSGSAWRWSLGLAHAR